jgi:hypothetical protein
VPRHGKDVILNDVKDPGTPEAAVPSAERLRKRTMTWLRRGAAGVTKAIDAPGMTMLSSPIFAPRSCLVIGRILASIRGFFADAAAILC